MVSRSAFQVQMLEKLGAPLLAAVGEVAARQEESGEKNEAALLAELLGRTVQAGVTLATSMGLKETGDQSDSIRLALAALSAPLLAGQYGRQGKMPGEGEVRRTVKALEAVLTFADSFIPAAENTERLESIKPGALADENQIQIQYVWAMLPVVNAVAAFPFGRPEGKLIREITDRLVARAETLGGNMPEDERKRAGLGFLAALAVIYAECHEAETKRLMAQDEEQRARLVEEAGGVLPLDSVWKGFEVRAAMLDVLAAHATPQRSESGGNSQNDGASVPAPQQEAVAEAEPVENEGPYNPMGFFRPQDKSGQEDA